jgi:CBS domain containing-hemolysin-like protein
VTGILALEDVLESLVGEEIVDEVDIAVDMVCRKGTFIS